MIEHSCNECVFLNTISGKHQCALNRLTVLPFNLDTNGNPVLSRFCNASRPAAWLDDLNVDESSDLIKTVMKEVEPRFGFFVLFNRDMETLEKTIHDIKSQSINARYVIVLTDAVEFNSAIQELLVKSFDFDITKHHIVQLLEMPKVQAFVIDEAFKHARNGWAYVCHSGHRIDHQLIEKAHRRINVDMKPLVVVQPYDDELNGLLFQTALFKFLNGNKVKIFSDEKSLDQSFLNKVREVAANSDPETFITWEEFNAV